MIEYIESFMEINKCKSREFIIVHFKQNFVSDSDKYRFSGIIPEWKADCNNNNHYCSLEDILIETLLHVVEDFR